MLAEPSSKMVPECPDHRRSERLNSGNIAAHSPRAGSNLGADDAHSDDHDLRAGPQNGGKAGGVAQGAQLVHIGSPGPWPPQAASGAARCRDNAVRRTRRAVSTPQRDGRSTTLYEGVEMVS